MPKPRIYKDISGMWIVMDGWYAAGTFSTWRAAYDWAVLYVDPRCPGCGEDGRWGQHGANQGFGGCC